MLLVRDFKFIMERIEVAAHKSGQKEFAKALEEITSEILMDVDKYYNERDLFYKLKCWWRKKRYE